MRKRVAALFIILFVINLFAAETGRAMGQVPGDPAQRGGGIPSRSKYPKSKGISNAPLVETNPAAGEVPEGAVKPKADTPAAQPGAEQPNTLQQSPEEAQTAASAETKETNGDSAKTAVASPPGQSVTSVSEVKPSSPSAKKLTVSKGNVSFFFDDVDMFEVIQSVFGEVLKVNYIIDPRVKGRVNFRTVAPIPINEVLPVMETILRLNGVGFVQENSLYRIVPIDVVSEELIYSQVGKEPGSVAMELFTFKNINVKDSLKDIENATGISVNGAKVRVLPVERLNGILVVASTKEQLEYVRRWVETFDVIFDGSRPEVYVYPVQNSNAKDVAAVLQQIFLGGKKESSPRTPVKESAAGLSSKAKEPAQPVAGIAAPQASSPSVLSGGGESLVSDVTRIFPDEIANTIIIYATPKDYELISRTITKIDVVPRQVMIEALVAEVALGDKLKFGIEWFLKSGFKFEGTPLTGLTSFGSQQLSFNPAATDILAATGFSFAAIDAANVVRGLLQTLASESKVKVLASPHIMASDNREAKIQVGKQVPVQTSTSVTSGGETVTSIQYRDTGVVLKVKPHINEGGLVSLEISQEVSSVDPESGVGDNPIISNRSAETNVVVQNEQTIVIGGLIQENKGTSREGIPVLKDVPLLGYLFGYTNHSTDRTELVVMITPKVVKSSAEAKTMTEELIKRTEGLKDLQSSFAKEAPAEGTQK
jgi:general secretion pathway protein D